MSYEMEIIMLNDEAEKYRKQGDKKKAMELFLEAIKLIDKHGTTPNTQAAICTNLGLLMCNFGQYKEAVKLQKRALDVDKQYGSKSDLGFSYHNLGFALKCLGKHKEAIKNLEEAQKIREGIKDYKELSHTYEILGLAYSEIKEYEKAAYYAKLGLKLGEGD